MFAVNFGEELVDKQITMFYSFNIFDSEDLDHPLKTRIANQGIDQGSKLDFDLTLHKLELSDNIYSPFKSAENISYLTLKEVKDINEDEDDRSLYFWLSNDLTIEKRSRYNIWDLLGDVGGFNDGLILVCQLLTASYSALSFKTKFLASSYFDANHDAQRQSSNENRSTVATIMDPA